MVILVSAYKYHERHDADHDQLDEQPADHDGPPGGGGHAKTLEDAFVAVPGYGIGITHDADGIKTDGDAVGKDKGAADFFDEGFPRKKDDDRREEHHEGG